MTHPAPPTASHEPIDPAALLHAQRVAPISDMRIRQVFEEHGAWNSWTTFTGEPTFAGELILKSVRVLLAEAVHPSPAPQAEAAVPVAIPDAWQPIKTAPRDGSNILLRFGVDGVSQGKFVPGGVTHPWKFIDTNDGITWLVNHAVDGLGGPSHWQPLPSANRAAAPQQQAAPAAPKEMK